MNDDKVTNRSGNRPFEDILKARMSRRSILAKGAALSATGFFAGIAADKLFGNAATAATSETFETAVSRSVGQTLLAQSNGGLIDFTPVTLADAAAGDGRLPLISPDYEYQVLIPWGTALKSGVPDYEGDPINRTTPINQLHQIGIGHDGMHFFPENGTSNTRGVLCINHEFGITPHVLGKILPESLDDVRTMQHAHGVSCVEIEKVDNTWQVVTGSQFNRRITVNTPVTFSGPAAGSPLLETGEAPLGTVNNCGNGATPWGTYLTCEENFNGYFNNSQVDQSNPPTDAQLGEGSALVEADPRYGIDAVGFGYAWGGQNGEVYDPRFDTSNPQFVNERNRFGWIVEIDPYDPTKPPVKRTGLGRFKHESAHVVEGENGRIVAYMGDDQRFDYIYRYVSNGKWRDMLRRGISPFDRGTLYVAEFFENGRGAWRAIDWNSSRVLRQNFDSQAEVLVNTRIAADLLGATPMDRPEWITSIGRDVYCNLTNNSQREVADGPNPLAPNPDGHILKLETEKLHTGLRFGWKVVSLAQDTHGTESSYSDPDLCYADPDGRLFIGTDGGQKDGLQDQLTVCDPSKLDPETGRIAEFRRLFMGVNSDEITGWANTPDRRTAFINIQHPGNGDPTVTNFPKIEQDGVTIPRDCTIVITKKDGGIIGS